MTNALSDSVPSMLHRSVPRSGGDVYEFGDGKQTEQRLKRVMRLIMPTVMAVLLRPSPLAHAQVVPVWDVSSVPAFMWSLWINRVMKLRAKFGQSVQGTFDLSAS